MRTKKGTVISAKNNKTAVVLVHIAKLDPILQKAYRSSKKYHAHDEDNRCKEGDEVQIIETIPISKLKCWKVDKILNKETDLETLKLADEEKIEKEIFLKKEKEVKEIKDEKIDAQDIKE